MSSGVTQRLVTGARRDGDENSSCIHRLREDSAGQSEVLCLGSVRQSGHTPVPALDSIKAHLMSPDYQIPLETLTEAFGQSN